MDKDTNFSRASHCAAGRRSARYNRGCRDVDSRRPSYCFDIMQFMCKLHSLAASVLAAAILLMAMDGSRILAADTVAIDRTVVAFLQTHCVRCHGPEKQSGELRFDAMPVALADEATAQRWQDILDALNLDVMPPAKEKQPDDAELSLVLETLTNNLREAQERLNDVGGKMVLRRLNRREYQNTIRALFGVDVTIEALPDDATVDGFDTIALAHSFSSLHLERYLKTGADVIESFMNRGTGTVPSIRRYEPEEAVLDGMQVRLDKLMMALPADGSEPKPGRKGERTRSQVQWLHSQLTRDYLGNPASKTGAIVPFRGLLPLFRADKLLGRVGEYKVRVRCGVDSPQPVEGVFLEVRRVPRQSLTIDHVECFQVRGTVAEPQVIEFDVIVDGMLGNYFAITRRTSRHDILERFANVSLGPYADSQVVRLADDELPGLWIDWVETEGPFPRVKGMLDPSIVALHPTNATDDQARTMIEAVATAAFRGQTPDPEFLQRVFDIYKSSRKNGATATDATRECLKVVLASPRFLFLYEPSVDDEKRRLTDRELAVRLSYMLWSELPDRPLYEAAERGELSTAAGLARQLDRMLDSAKSQQFLEHFVTQFFELGRLTGVSPDATPSPKYDRALQEATQREVIETFRFLLRHDRPAYDLINADYVVINGLLADFYGLPGVYGDEYREVKLPTGSPRGGLLGQSAILTLSGTGKRTSPVERGAFVLRKLLHRPPPPAPANVPRLDEADLGNRSIRDTLSTHMTLPQCSSCHRRIDPLGFGLENFDPVGLWRDSVMSADKSQRFSIEPAGLMPDGKRQFANPAEMKLRMMEDRDDFLTGLTEAIMTYGIGRKVGYADRTEVERIVADTAEQGAGLRTLLHEIVKSTPFQTK